MKEERNQALLEILNTDLARRNQEFVGREVEVLVEGRSERNAERLFGRTGSNKGVVFPGPERLRGQLLPVRVERASAVTLVGDPVIRES